MSTQAATDRHGPKAVRSGPSDQGRPPQAEGRRTGSIIYLEDVTVDYDGFKALNQLNFYMDYRELRVVIGPNGAGKTTLLDVISGRVKPDQGRLIFGHATDLLPLGIEEIASLGIGRKFQTPSVFVNLTVWENVELSLRRARRGVFATLFAREGDSEDRDRIAATLDAVGLATRAARLAGTLAHGERQWLEIGMVMAQEPELLLVDEPVAGLTDEETARTGELLEAIASERAVLVIEHDMEFVRRIARRVTVLHQGSVLCEGPVDQVQTDPRVLEVYLGHRQQPAAHDRGDGSS